jgi:hypothetical protein
VTPDGPKEIAITSTTGIVADQTLPHFMRELNIDAGWAFSGATGGGARVRNAVVGLQWLSHGRTHASEDQHYTLLMPTVIFGSDVTDVGVVPFAYNLGSLPRTPGISNLWAGPYVSRSRVGGVIVVKF